MDKPEPLLSALRSLFADCMTEDDMLSFLVLKTARMVSSLL
jgi:hypothetical protein